MTNPASAEKSTAADLASTVAEGHDATAKFEGEELDNNKLESDELVVEDMLVEEVSIDGMCGVY